MEIAKAEAAKNSDFHSPFVESVLKQVVTDNWVVRILSTDPSDTARTPGSLGARYMIFVIDRESGAILSVDLGGGS